MLIHAGHASPAARPSRTALIVRPAGEAIARCDPHPVVSGVNFERIRSARFCPAVTPASSRAYTAGTHEYVLVESGTLRLTAVWSGWLVLGPSCW